MTDRLLLDSNVLVFFDHTPERIPGRTLERIQNATDVYVSAVTAWELAIKQAIGSLNLASPVSNLVQKLGFIELPISIRHGEAIRSLPLFHRDPFDRLLLAQAQVENLILVTADRRLAQYGIPVLQL